MAISYKNLWKLLIDRDMKKKDLQELAGISAASITKLGKNENVNTEIISKICVALKCDVSDIMEIISDNENIQCLSVRPAKGVQSDRWNSCQISC